MKTAQEMFNYHKQHKLGNDLREEDGLAYFAMIASELQAGEDVKIVFAGLHGFQSMIKHSYDFAYAISDRRILMAQPLSASLDEGKHRWHADTLITVDLRDVKDITMTQSFLMASLTIKTTKTDFVIGLDKASVKQIHEKVRTLVFGT